MDVESSETVVEVRAAHVSAMLMGGFFVDGELL